MFTISTFPAEARSWFDMESSMWRVAVKAAIEGGVRDRNKLANLAFFMMHKDRMNGDQGKPLATTEPKFATLAAEWDFFATFADQAMAAVPMRGGSTSKRKPRPIPGTTPSVDTITRVGSFCGSASLGNPERDVDFAVENGINRLDIMVNDHAKQRGPRSFSMRSSGSIETLTRRAIDHGIEVHLVSWIMPHAEFIDGAARELIPLANSIGATSVQWDAEEPWTKATKRLSYADAATRIGDRFADRTFEMGVTAIGFCDKKKIGPLADVCDYTLPQAYSTSNQLKPGQGQRMLHKRYATAFAKPVVMGLAAYRQSGIAGHTPHSAMTACVEASAAVGCDTVVYWSLRHIRSSKSAQRVISAIR